MPELVLKLGDEVLEKFVFDKDIVSIGRARDNDIVIENLSVSRNHARIRRQGGKFVLTDLHSANGTFVNAVRVTKTEIVDGDVLSVGKHRILFRNPVEEEDQIAADALGSDRTMVVDRAPVGMLSVVEGKLKGREYPLTKFDTTIGKASSNDIVIGEDWFLSKKQAIITRRDRHFEIRDLGGFRKTKVNGKPVTDAVELRPGDVVEFGNTRCVFQMGSAHDGVPAGARVPRELGLDDSIYAGSQEFHEHMEALAAGARAAAEQPEQAGAVPTEEESPATGVAAAARVVDMEPATSQPATSKQPAVPVLDLKAILAAEGAGIAPDEPEPAAEPQPAAPPEPEPEPEPEQPATAAEEPHEEPIPVGGRHKKKKDKQRRERAAAAVQDAPPAAESSPDLVTVSFEAARAVLEAEQPPADDADAPEAAPAAEPAPDRQSAPPAEQHGGGDVEKEIRLWEAALNNNSPVIRKHAARMLKKLTGKDYAY